MAVAVAMLHLKHRITPAQFHLTRCNKAVGPNSSTAVGADTENARQFERLLLPLLLKMEVNSFKTLM